MNDDSYFVHCKCITKIISTKTENIWMDNGPITATNIFDLNKKRKTQTFLIYIQIFDSFHWKNSQWKIIFGIDKIYIHISFAPIRSLSKNTRNWFFSHSMKIENLLRLSFIVYQQKLLDSRAPNMFLVLQISYNHTKFVSLTTFHFIQFRIHVYHYNLRFSYAVLLCFCLAFVVYILIGFWTVFGVNERQNWKRNLNCPIERWL